jgi:STE24 endopeptidase
MGLILQAFQLCLFNKKFVNAFNLRRPTNMILFVFFNFFLTPFEMFFGFLVNFVSRKNEFQADQFANRNGRGQELKNALIKLFKKD